jgi:phenylalanyl-tRNA synthetase beta chain
MFSEYCENKFEVEPVEVVHHDGSKTVYPDLSCYKIEAPLSHILGPIGISLDVKQVRQVPERFCKDIFISRLITE